MAAGDPVQAEPGEVHLASGLGCGAGRQETDPAVAAHQHVQVPVGHHELEQPGRTLMPQPVQQRGHVERACPRYAAARRGA